MELVRIGSMLGRLNAELQEIDLDQPAVDRLAHLHGEVLGALRENLPGDLVAELEHFVPGLGDADGSPTSVRLAHLQLVGWLEGLFQGIKVNAMGEQLRRRSAADGAGEAPPPIPPGTYL